MADIKFYLTWHDFKRTPAVASSVAKTDQKKQKDRYSANACVQTQWHNETELIIKFDKSVLWIWNFIILQSWKTKLQKCSLCAFCLVIELRYFLE